MRLTSARVLFLISNWSSRMFMPGLSAAFLTVFPTFSRRSFSTGAVTGVWM